MSLFSSIGNVFKSIVKPVVSVARTVAPIASQIFPTLTPTLSALTGSLDPMLSAVKTYAPAMAAATSFALPGVSSFLSPMLRNFGETPDEDSTEYMPEAELMMPPMMQGRPMSQPLIRTLPALPSWGDTEEEGGEDLGSLMYDEENDVYIDPDTGDVYGY